MLPSLRRCYITNDTVKMVTTVGVFGLVFIFNVILLVVTIKRVMTLCHSKEVGVSLHCLCSALPVFK